MSNETSAVNGQAGLNTLLGGAEMTVRLKDGSTCAVWVRQLEIEDYPRLLGLMEDERGQVELYCRVPGTSGPALGDRTEPPKGWAKQLTPESHDQVMEKAEELNKDFFSRWLRRRLEKVERIRPGLLERAIEGARPGAGSGERSPAS